MREISACGSAPAGGGDRAQQAVDAHAHDQAGAERLDVDVARAQLHRPFEQVVDRAHDRRAAREVAQVFDIVVGMREPASAACRRRVVVAQAARSAP